MGPKIILKYNDTGAIKKFNNSAGSCPYPLERGLKCSFSSPLSIYGGGSPPSPFTLENPGLVTTTISRVLSTSCHGNDSAWNEMEWSSRAAYICFPTQLDVNKNNVFIVPHRVHIHKTSKLKFVQTCKYLKSSWHAASL